MRITLFLFLCAGSFAAAQVTAPYAQNFDAIAAPTTITPANLATTLGPNWQIAMSDCAGRIRVLDTVAPANSTLPTGFVGAPSVVGPPSNSSKFLALDRNPTLPTPTCNLGPGFTTNEVVLRINGMASNLGAGFRISFYLREIADETQPEDVIALTDGVTPGFGVTRTGAATATPGYGGHKEALLLDWNTAGITTNWVNFDISITSAFLAAQGMVFSNDMRLVIRQNDNLGTNNGNDGFCIDFVRVESIMTGGGQAPQPGLATLDLNGAVEMNGNPVTSQFNGPYSTSVPAGGNLSFLFEGTPGKPVVLLAGALNVACANYVGIGQVDIGAPNPPGPPTGIIIVADGNSTAGFGPFFVLNAAGNLTTTFSTFGLPIGFQITYQAAILTNGPGVVALSNAVTLNIQ